MNLTEEKKREQLDNSIYQIIPLKRGQTSGSNSIMKNFWKRVAQRYLQVVYG